MASLEGVGGLDDINDAIALDFNEILTNDENTPLSPGEVKVMRNQSNKGSTRMVASSRKATKAFHVHDDSQQSSSSSSKMCKSAVGLDSQERRKTLQVLQPSAKGNGVLVGSTVIRQQKLKGKEKQSKHTKGHGTQQAREDSSSASDSSDTDKPKHTDKDLMSDEALALMVQDPAPESYWQIMAEERRLALQDALEENLKLCKQLEEMKERCDKLEEVAGQAEYFASLYAMVMEGDSADLDSNDGDEPDTRPEEEFS